MDPITIKDIRDSYGLTQADLGRIMGVAQNSVGRLDRKNRGLTQGHKAALFMFEYIAANDLFVDFMRCLDSKIADRDRQYR